MRKELKHILMALFIVLSLPAAAKEIYIKAVSLKYERDLLPVKASLNDLGYAIRFAYRDQRYHVFVGPFKERSAAEKALERIQKYFSRNAVIVGDRPAEEKHETVKAVPPLKQTDQDVSLGSGEQKNIVLKSKPAPEPVKRALPVEGSLFVSVSAGYAAVDYSENVQTGTFTVENKPGAQGETVGIEGGYNINEQFFVTLNFNRTGLKNAFFYHIFTTLNYKFDTQLNTSPYIGLLLGYSIMNWRTSPITAPDNDLVGSSGLGGAQAGMEVSVTDSMSLAFFYRFMLMGHSTEITSPTGFGTLENTYEHAVNAGIKYRF